LGKFLLIRIAEHRALVLQRLLQIDVRLLHLCQQPGAGLPRTVAENSPVCGAQGTPEALGDQDVGGIVDVSGFGDVSADRFIDIRLLSQHLV
jgi:hypothetical protein